MVWFVSEYASIKKYTTRLIGWFTVVQLGANLLKLEPPNSTSQVDVQPQFAADLQASGPTYLWMYLAFAARCFEHIFLPNFGI